VRTYNKLKKSLLLIFAIVFFLSSFAGKLLNCICEDTIEVITEETTCCNEKTDCSDSETETKAKDTYHEKHNCGHCNVCSVTKQKIEQHYNISYNKTLAKEILKHYNESCNTATFINSEHISYPKYFPVIHSRIFISVSNLRI
jgi:hypothetical protein